jgi:TatD family-associated radical SAM protein
VNENLEPAKNSSHTDEYVYILGNNIYINLTNKCTNKCDFCVRGAGVEDWYLNGANLWLSQEPTANDVIEALQKNNFKRYDSVVFCGYGEPLIRLETCIGIAKWLKKNGAKSVRVNTNGQANLIHNRDVSAELVGLFDCISISLNASNSADYQAVCHCCYGEVGFDSMLNFAQKCVDKGLRVVMSVVDILPKDEIIKCGEIVLKIGAEFKVRELIK